LPMSEPIDLLRETGRWKRAGFSLSGKPKIVRPLCQRFCLRCKKASTIFIKEVTLRAGVMNHLGRWVEPLPVPADNPLR
jgi:hypothetical protein